MLDINAIEMKVMMKHKDDIIFGVFERIKHEIIAAALKGSCGVIVDYLVEYDKYKEIDIMYNWFDEKGFTCVDVSSDNPVFHRIAIYWDVD